MTALPPEVRAWFDAKGWSPFPFQTESWAAYARGELAIFPELGVFYAPNDLLAAPDWIVVPSLTIAGDRLLRALGIGG